MGKRNYHKWSQKEVTELKKLCDNPEYDGEMIANELDLTKRQIYNKCQDLGLEIKKSPPEKLMSSKVDFYKWLYQKRIKHRLEKQDNGCIEWKGSQDGKGYGQINTGYYGKKGVHRVVKTVKLERELRENEEVCHTCDNPKCVNDEHLFVGDHSDNMKDMSKKERGKKQFKKGGGGQSNRGGSKIDSLTAKEIRSHYMEDMSKEKLAKKYDLTEASIHNIINGKSWDKNTCFFDLDDIPPSKNTYDSKHYTEQNRIHKSWKEKAFYQCPQEKKYDVPVTANFIFSLPNAKIRDVENFVIHGILDGIEQTGVIKDDSYKYVTEIRKRAVLYDPKAPRTRIWLEPYDAKVENRMDKTEQ